MRASSYTVDRLPTRTVAPHGVTGEELRRFDGACHLMQRVARSQGQLWWLTTPKGSSRNEIAAYQKRITSEQSAHGYPQYSVWIFESRPKLHAHILFLGNPGIADALRRSRLCIGTKIGPVVNLEGLKKKYLAKERTPQAGYGRRDLGGRIRGQARYRHSVNLVAVHVQSLALGADSGDAAVSPGQDRGGIYAIDRNARLGKVVAKRQTR